MLDGGDDDSPIGGNAGGDVGDIVFVAGFDIIPDGAELEAEAEEVQEDPGHGFDMLHEQGAPEWGKLPRGVAWRSPGHTLIMRMSKQIRVKEKAASEVASGIEALQGAWNAKVGLRLGDQVAVGPSGKWVHGNTWSHTGLLRVAWAQVGQHPPPAPRGKGGVGETRRSADSLLSLAGALQLAVRGKLESWLSSLAGEGLHIERHHDATQLRLRFGGLQERLCPQARYTVPDLERPGRYKLVPWSEFRRRFPKAQPVLGHLEFFADQLSMHAVFPTGIEDSRHVFLAPKILTHATASAVYSAVEELTPELTLNRVKALCHTHRIVTISEVPDSSSVNIRKKAFSATQLPATVLYTPLTCSAHLLHRVIVVASREAKLVGHCHAVHLVTRSPRHAEVIAGALRQTVDEDFEWLPGPGPADYRPHLKSILEHGILRRLDHTTGSLAKEAIFDPDGRDDALREPISAGDRMWNRRRHGAALLLKFCQSDPRGQRIIHYCSGCCTSRGEALDHVTAAIAQAGLLKGFASVTPSSSRHGSVTESMGEQVAGMLCYNILGRVMAKAFPKWESMNVGPIDENDDDDRDQRAYMRGKTYRATKYLCGQGNRMLASLMSWVTEPVDYLWMRLQHLDARHSSLIDAVTPHRSPFDFCMRQLCGMMLSPFRAGHLAPVFEHWGEDEWLKHECRCTLASMICQIYWRFGRTFSTWPFLIARAVDPCSSDADRLELFSKLYREPACCLDPYFALKLRALCADAAELNSDGRILQGLRLWARHTKISNMECERLLAKCKASSPEKHPMVERVVATSFLSQWLQAHREAGGVDPRRSETRKALLKKQVRLACGRASGHKKRAAQPKKSRGFWAYVKKHRFKGKLPNAARLAETSRLAFLFSSLPPEDRVAYSVEERATRAQNDTATPEPDESKYERLVPGSLFGLSNHEEPFMVSEFEKVAQSVMPPGLQGMRNYAKRLRASFSAKIVVDDSGAIPKRLKLPHLAPCHLKHTGLCPCKTPTIFKEGVRFAAKLVEEALNNYQVGSVISLVRENDTRVFVGMVGFLRRQRPKETVVLAMETDAAECGDDHEGIIRVSEQGGCGMLLPLCSTEIAASVLLLHNAGIISLRLRPLVVAWDHRRPGVCAVQEVGEGTGVDLLARSVVAPPAGVGADRGAAGQDAIPDPMLAGFECLPGGQQARSGREARAKPKVSKPKVSKKRGDFSDEDSIGLHDFDDDEQSYQSSTDGSDSTLLSDFDPGDVCLIAEDGRNEQNQNGGQEFDELPQAPAGSVGLRVQEGGASGSRDPHPEQGPPLPPPLELPLSPLPCPNEELPAQQSLQPAQHIDRPPEVPPPPAPHPVGRRPRGRGGGRGSRQIPWGPFSLAVVLSNGEQIGWGATCGMHSNSPEDREQCKKQITYGKEKWSDAQCILGLKRWLHWGHTADFEDQPRKMHVKQTARRADGLDEATLDTWAASL